MRGRVVVCSWRARPGCVAVGQGRDAGLTEDVDDDLAAPSNAPSREPFPATLLSTLVEAAKSELGARRCTSAAKKAAASLILLAYHSGPNEVSTRASEQASSAIWAALLTRGRGLGIELGRGRASARGSGRMALRGIGKEDAERYEKGWRARGGRIHRQ